MHQILLQPASNKIARDNYHRTIQNPIPLNKILPIIENDVLQMKIEKPALNKTLHIWGVTNDKKWKRIQKKDTALFYQKGRIIAGMNVSGKLISRKLAEYLWNDAEWKNIYFGNSIQKLNIPIEEFNDIVGYDKKYTPHKFDILSSDNPHRPINTLKVLDSLGIGTKKKPESISPQLLTVEQVSLILNLESEIVIKLIKESDLAACKIGNFYRISPADLNKFIFNHSI